MMGLTPDFKELVGVVGADFATATLAENPKIVERLVRDIATIAQVKLNKLTNG